MKVSTCLPPQSSNPLPKLLRFHRHIPQPECLEHSTGLAKPLREKKMCTALPVLDMSLGCACPALARIQLSHTQTRVSFPKVPAHFPASLTSGRAKTSKLACEHVGSLCYGNIAWYHGNALTEPLSLQLAEHMLTGLNCEQRTRCMHTGIPSCSPALEWLSDLMSHLWIRLWETKRARAWGIFSSAFSYTNRVCFLGNRMESLLNFLLTLWTWNEWISIACVPVMLVSCEYHMISF